MKANKPAFAATLLALSTAAAAMPPTVSKNYDANMAQANATVASSRPCSTFVRWTCMMRPD